MSLRAIELFTGCGGMSLGLKRAGFDIVYANEINEDAVKTYRKNFPDVFVQQEDIKKVNPVLLKKKIGQIDLIAAGTPCQGFSMAGPRNPNDPRNKLFLQLLKFVDTFKPKMFVMENVPGILTMDEGKVIKRIENAFSKIGYVIQYKVLIASDFGVPQERKRIFIVGSKEKISSEKLFPTNKKTRVTVEEALSDLADLRVNDRSTTYKNKPKSKFQSKMRQKSNVIFNHESCNHNIKIQQRFAMVPAGKNGRQVLINSGTKKRDYYRMHPKTASRTITTIPEDFIHYKQNRIPTVREMARLQSFPDNFEFLGPKMTGGKRRTKSCPQYTQVANAVPPLLAEVVFKKIRNCLA